MANELEFFFDYVSPYSHVANAAVKDVIERTGARLIVRPMFLGVSCRPPATAPPARWPLRQPIWARIWRGVPGATAFA